MGNVILELKDMRHLEWARVKHSSGTAGSFLKAEETIDGIKWYYKLSSFDAVKGTFGHECVNEIVVDRLLSYLDIPHLSYDLLHALVMVDGVEMETYLCASKNFRKNHESKTSFENFYALNKEDTESAIEFVRRMGWEQNIYDMMLTDFLILNRDRHGANVEVLKDTASKEIRLAPLFDHGLSFIFSCHLDHDIRCFDVLEDKKVQSFLGGNSTLENLKLIPRDRMRDLAQLAAFSLKDLDFLFKDLEGTITPLWKETVARMILGRAKQYEGLRSQK